MCFGVWGRVELRLSLDLFCSEEGERQDATRFLEGGHEYLSGAFMLVEYRGVSVGAWWCDIGQQGQDNEPIWAEARKTPFFNLQVQNSLQGRSERLPPLVDNWNSKAKSLRRQQESEARVHHSRSL